ncbi:MAG TPA: hypothetical protein VK116_03225 [Planctomycetota bacterium]|nr:hypothetical protein [Planctomycetota bacterium]
MRLSGIRWIGAVLLLYSATGCAGRSIGQAIVDYPIDRAADLIDILGFDLYWGRGVLAQAQATKVVQAGAGTFDGKILKYARRSIGISQELRAEAGLPLYYFTAYDRKAVAGNERFLENHADLEGLGEAHYNLTDPNDRGFYEVGGRAAVFVGVGVSFDVLQLADFFVGFFGADIGNDDRRHQADPTNEPIENPRYKGPGDRPISGGEPTLAARP